MIDQLGPPFRSRPGGEWMSRTMQEYDRGEKRTPIRKQLVACTVYAAGRSTCGTRRV
ncbi:MAG: hypothetical protein M3305_04225 [Actinomycetota bacterium]|nr:hypothetical protein [Actinomycetota bacterium]